MKYHENASRFCWNIGLTWYNFLLILGIHRLVIVYCGEGVMVFGVKVQTAHGCT